MSEYNVVISPEGVELIDRPSTSLVVDGSAQLVAVTMPDTALVVADTDAVVSVEHPEIEILTVSEAGPRGEQGVPGLSGNVPGPPGMDPEQGEDGFSYPGDRGLTGAASTVPGPMGLSIPGQDGIDGEDSLIPGPPGPSVQGLPGITVPGQDGADGEDGFSYPGKDGTPGATGAASMIPGPTGPPGMDGESESGGEGLIGIPTPTSTRWPFVYPTVDNGDTCTIPAGYQLLVASRFSVLGMGRLVNNGKLVVL